MNENETNVVEQPASIPFYVHEGEINRLERINKRFFILLLIVFFALVGTNAYWIWYESQFEDVVVTQDVSTGEGAAVVSGTGDISYGEDKTNSENPPQEDGREQRIP